MSVKRIIISGASGLIGRALTRSFEGDGVEVVRLVRRSPASPSEVEWAPGDRPLDTDVLAGAAAVVNLNGASIGRLPWTKSYRETLRVSRLAPTRTLAAALRGLGEDAPLLVSASAVGFYGNRPGEVLTEGSRAGETFLARLCLEWESAALAAGDPARVALIRTAPLLHPLGMLKPLMPLTRLGVSGPLGGGRQFWPWISLDDEVRAIRHIIDRGITGAVNLCGPQLASANDIGAELARQLRRPFIVPAPRWALRLGLGRAAADSLLLPDARVEASVLADTGFEFEHRTVAAAIAAVLAPSAASAE